MTQDFSGQNLRGRSFRGRKDLVGANFSYADIRGADFTNALLIEANFSQAQAGRERFWTVALLVISLVLSTLSGVVSAFVGVITGNVLISQNPIEILAGVVILMALAGFVLFSIRRGLLVACGVLAVVGITAAAIATHLTGFGSVAVAMIAATGAVAIAVIAAAATAGTGAGSMAVVGAAAATAAGITVAMSGTTAVAGAVAAAVAVAIAMAVTGLAASMSWKALAGEKDYTLIRHLAIALTAMGGTCFREANLTQADFTQATLESTTFSKANLTRTCWFQAKKLDMARVEKTYLENAQVRQLVVTGEGIQQSFDHLYLRGVNLRGANLMEASFVGADLSESNLQSANLSRANLTQAQLDRTDLTGACLAGTRIEDWGITGETKFDKVQYENIFKRLGNKRHSKPKPPPLG